jgi:hypothetical protein
MWSYRDLVTVKIGGPHDARLVIFGLQPAGAGRLDSAGRGVLFRLAWLADAVAGRLIPFMLGVVYVVLIIKFWATAEGGFSSLQGVKSLFQSDWLLLAGWVHYLAFDLFVGAWIARTTVQSRLSRLVLAPILPLTFLFGPAGFVAFELTRRIAVLSLCRTALLSRPAGGCGAPSQDRPTKEN